VVIDQLSPGQHTSRTAARADTGPLDKGAFERSSTSAVRRHESLRDDLVASDRNHPIRSRAAEIFLLLE